MSVRYLAYGSNLHPVRLSDRLGAANLLGTTRLPQRALRFNKRGLLDGSGKCNIVPAESEIFGAVYEMPVADKRRLDQIEGVGRGYVATRVTVADFGQCHLYVADHSHVDHEIRPFSWYLELVLAGCEALAFPPDYIDKIRAQESIQDTDRQRHEHHMRIVRQAKQSPRTGPGLML